MRLFIAEKPSLARAIAAVLPQPQKASRLYIEAGKGDVKCPKCGAKMVLRDGKNGPFWGCSKYPECRSTVSDQNGRPVFEQK